MVDVVRRGEVIDCSVKTGDIFDTALLKNTIKTFVVAEFLTV